MIFHFNSHNRHYSECIFTVGNPICKFTGGNTRQWACLMQTSMLLPSREHPDGRFAGSLCSPSHPLKYIFKTICMFMLKVVYVITAVLHLHTSCFSLYTWQPLTWEGLHIFCGGEDSARSFLLNHINTCKAITRHKKLGTLKFYCITI